MRLLLEIAVVVVLMLAVSLGDDSYKGWFERDIGILRYAPDKEDREDAAKRLSRASGNEKVADALVRALREDPKKHVRRESARSLGQIGVRSKNAPSLLRLRYFVI